MIDEYQVRVGGVDAAHFRIDYLEPEKSKAKAFASVTSFALHSSHVVELVKVDGKGRTKTIAIYHEKGVEKEDVFA